MESHEKLRIAVRYRLLGAASANPEFKVALAAFDFAEAHTTGFRKDGKTPSFAHPIAVVAYLMTLQPSLRHPAETLASAALHDVVEDSNVGLDEIHARFGQRVAHATLRLSKVIGGVKVCTLEEYFERMLDCPIAPCVKGADRSDNQGSMVGVFTVAKQHEYLDESEQHILPMLKKARRQFSDQEAVFENLKRLLRSQVQLIRAMHKAPV